MGTDQTDTSDIPAGLDVGRHRDWAGRARYLWIKRAITGALVVFIALALLNQFGQRASASTSSTPSATLTITTPHDLRLGLIFQTRLDVLAKRTIAHPRVVLSGEWFNGTTLNETEPSATTETPGRGGAVSFAYPALHAARTMTVWFEWSANPTHVAWSRAQTVTVYDGDRPLVTHTIHVTVFP